MTIFFINRFNDIDHISHVIYKIGKQTDQNIQVISLNSNKDIFTIIE